MINLCHYAVLFQSEWENQTHVPTYTYNPNTYIMHIQYTHAHTYSTHTNVYHTHNKHYTNTTHTHTMPSLPCAFHMGY